MCLTLSFWLNKNHKVPTDAECLLNLNWPGSILTQVLCLQYWAVTQVLCLQYCWLLAIIHELPVKLLHVLSGHSCLSLLNTLLAFAVYRDNE